MEELRLTTDLRGAAERNEFVLAREPIVRLRDGAQVGCGALIRWQRPRLGMLSPQVFARRRRVGRDRPNRPLRDRCRDPKASQPAPSLS
jgi:predicted signal transduction protein with EAL and GGDEF domain